MSETLPTRKRHRGSQRPRTIQPPPRHEMGGFIYDIASLFVNDAYTRAASLPVELRSTKDISAAQMARMNAICAAFVFIRDTLHEHMVALQANSRRGRLAARAFSIACEWDAIIHASRAILQHVVLVLNMQAFEDSVADTSAARPAHTTHATVSRHMVAFTYAVCRLGVMVLPRTAKTVMGVLWMIMGTRTEQAFVEQGVLASASEFLKVGLALKEDSEKHMPRPPPEFRGVMADLAIIAAGFRQETLREPISWDDLPYARPPPLPKITLTYDCSDTDTDDDSKAPPPPKRPRVIIL